ncbi:MAG: protoporphyrinogen oxidase [Bacteroidetes bacterium QS_8_68_15]|nr:MAG: protoporphyrinogen oxidase [Bacteroidetes bacterium QS_8_68_15]
MSSVGVIGAGIAGLTAAYRLEEAGLAPTVFEQRARPGGMIHSERFDAPTTEGEYLVEFGPNSLRASTSLLRELFDDLDLTEEHVEAADAAARRYVVFSGRPVALPGSLRELLSTELLSPQAKLRLLAEPFVGSVDDEESVAEFARRRLGTEVLDYGLNPFTAGVFAGDPEELSIQHAFPRIHALEQTHGSLLGGGVRSAAGRWVQRMVGGSAEEDATLPQRGVFSLESGLEALPYALADHLSSGGVRYETAVRSLHRSSHAGGDADTASWRVRSSRDAGGASLDEERFDALVWAAPLPELLRCTDAVSADFAPLEEVSYPPVSVVAMGFPRDRVEHPLDGFGLLVPEAEATPRGGCRSLGTLFSSSVFPHRAPEGRVLLTTFVGGTRNPELAGASDEEVFEAAHHDLRYLLGAYDPPVFQRRMHWPRAIPQYHVGYGGVKDAIDQIEADAPGLHLAGNYRSGVSVGDAAESGNEAARRIAERVA